MTRIAQTLHLASSSQVARAAPSFLVQVQYHLSELITDNATSDDAIEGVELSSISDDAEPAVNSLVVSIGQALQQAVLISNGMLPILNSTGVMEAIVQHLAELYTQIYRWAAQQHRSQAAPSGMPAAVIRTAAQHGAADESLKAMQSKSQSHSDPALTEHDTTVDTVKEHRRQSTATLAPIPGVVQPSTQSKDDHVYEGRVQSISIQSPALAAAYVRKDCSDNKRAKCTPADDSDSDISRRPMPQHYQPPHKATVTETNFWVLRACLELASIDTSNNSLTEEAFAALEQTALTRNLLLNHLHRIIICPSKLVGPFKACSCAGLSQSLREH